MNDRACIPCANENIFGVLCSAQFGVARPAIATLDDARMQAGGEAGGSFHAHEIGAHI